jgi:MscS family membrane protein
VLALVIVAGGVLLALMVRAIILFWGGRISARTRTTLDEAAVPPPGQRGRRRDRLSEPGRGRAGAAVSGLVAMVLNRLLVSLLILHLMRAALRGAHLALLTVSEIEGPLPHRRGAHDPALRHRVHVVIIVIAAYALLQVWNIDPTAWLASAGVIGIAVGFAAKDTLANLFAGFFIIADAPYKVGDYIVLDSGDRGEVTRVGHPFDAHLLTRDDVEIIIPNADGQHQGRQRVGRPVAEVPHPHQGRRGVRLGRRSGHDRCSSASRSNTTASAATPNRAYACAASATPASTSSCSAGSSTRPSAASSHITCTWIIYKALGREGIEIPFPQRDVWAEQHEWERSSRAVNWVLSARAEGGRA